LLFRFIYPQSVFKERPFQILINPVKQLPLFCCPPELLITVTAGISAAMIQPFPVRSPEVNKKNVSVRSPELPLNTSRSYRLPYCPFS